MPAALAAAAMRRTMRAGTTGSRLQEMDMTWQTPQAQDFRFGFEITMYVAAR
jgi:coenzyme PQQ precursor peptide PqqA